MKTNLYNLLQNIGESCRKINTIKTRLETNDALLKSTNRDTRINAFTEKQQLQDELNKEKENINKRINKYLKEDFKSNR